MAWDSWLIKILISGLVIYFFFNLGNNQVYRIFKRFLYRLYALHNIFTVSEFWTEAFWPVVNDCTRCPGIMASLAFSQILSLIARRLLRLKNWLRICWKIYDRRKTRYTPGTSGIYLSLILLCKKELTFIVLPFELKVCVRVELCYSVELEGGSAA